MGVILNNKKNIAKSAIAVSAVSVVALCFSFLKESVFAYYYGATAATDAYVIAIQLPTTLFSLISTAISNVVLPHYARKQNKDGAIAASDYVSNLMTVITICSLAIVIIIELFSSFFIAAFVPGLSSETIYLASTLFRLVLPTIILTELMNINTAVLNVHKSFVLPSFASVFLNVTFVSIVAVLARRQGIHAAVWGTILGTLVEFAYSVILRRKYMRYRWICNLRDADMIDSVKKAVPVCLGIGAEEINRLVDQMVSSFLDTGAISMLNYASKLSSAIATLVIQGITTVVYPEFAEGAAQGDERRMADSVLFSIQILLFIIMPIIIGGSILSRELITIVYRRGAFDAYSVRGTAPLFACYLACLLFRALRQILSRVYYSYGDTKTPMKNSFVGIVINIILDITVVKYFGALGLAMATTVAMAVISFLLLHSIRKKNPYIQYRKLLPFALRIIISCAMMSAVLVVCKKIAVSAGLYDMSSFGATFAIAAALILLGGLAYFLGLILLRTQEILFWVKSIVRRKK